MNWIEEAPLWLVAPLLMVSLVALNELGMRLARSGAQQNISGEARGYMVSSALALLGLLMAFTFSAAQARFVLRQELVVAEANAISTTYLRIQLLDQPWRADLSRQIVQYAQLRAGFDEAAGPNAIADNARQTAAAQGRIWEALGGAVHANTILPVNLALINSANETFDLAATRRAARETCVPPSILYALLASSLLVSGMVGFAAGGGKQVHIGVSTGVMALVTLAFCLILDLDRPVSGAVRVSSAPMQYMLDDVRRSEAAAAQAP